MHQKRIPITLDEVMTNAETQRAWSRSGLSSPLSNASTPRLAASDLARLLRVDADLVRAAAPQLLALSEAAQDERHLSLLCERNGVVLALRGDGLSVRSGNRPPIPGTVLAEGIAGPNAFGAAIRDGAAARFNGEEQCVPGLAAFVSIAVPLRGSGGRLRGALGIAVRSPLTASRMCPVLEEAAERLGAALR